MAKLPTEQDISDLPDRLPRRGGVGGWNPNTLMQGTQDIARGLETMGTDMSMFGATVQRQQDASQMANADASYAVGRIKTTTDLSQTTDPSAATGFTKAYGDNFNAAASTIQDPNLRQRWQTLKSADLAEDQARVAGHVTKLNNNLNVAGWMTQGDDTISAAIGAPDTPDGQAQRAAAIDAWNQKGAVLMQGGAITPEQYVQRRQQFGAAYGRTWARSLMDDAQKTGDTSKLEELEKNFTFGPPPTAPQSGQPVEIAPQDRDLMIRTIYGEAGGEPEQGQAAVAAVIRNRLSSGKYGSSVSAVINAPGQFSLWNRGDPAGDLARGLSPNSPAYQKIGAIVDGVMGGKIADPTNGAPNYYNPKDANPAWGPQLASQNDVTIGNHRFVGSIGSAPQQQGGSFGAIGDSLGVGVAGVVGQKVTDGWAKESLPPQTIISNINALPTMQLAGKRIILSTGASNDPSQDPAKYVADQISALKAKGVDPSQVTIAGVGPKFDAVKIGGLSLNDALNKAATDNGASFVPLDPSKIGPDGVHPTAAGYADMAARAGFGSQVNTTAGLPPGATANPFIGLPPISGGKVTWGAPTTPPANDTAAKVGSPSPAGGPWAAAADGTLVATDAKGNAVTTGDKTSQQVAQADTGTKSDATMSPAGAPTLPGGAVNPHLVPPAEAWPKGATGVTPSPDGSWSYVMGDGSIQKAPDVRASGAPGAPAPYRTGTPIDWMHPQDKAELGLALQNKIDQIQRQKVADASQFATHADQDMTARIKDLVSGQTMADKEYDSLKQAYANSPDPGVRMRFAQMDNIRINLQAYQGKSPPQVAADIANKSAVFDALKRQNPDDPRLPLMAATLDASQQFLKTYQTEAVKDPIGRAALAGALPPNVTALAPNDQKFEASLATRLADRATAEQFLGLPAGSTNVFRPGEVSAFKKVAAQGGDPMVSLAQNIVQGAGPNAGAVFRELGGDAPAFQSVGALAAGGGDPEAINDIASVIHARQDKTAGRDLPTFNEGFLRANSFEDPMGGAAARFGPDGDSRLRAAANLLMTAQASRDGKDPKINNDTSYFTQDWIDRAYNRAAGGTYDKDGTQYGGLTDRSAGGGFLGFGATKERVLAPNTMKADDFNSVVGSITNSDLQGMKNPPAGANGQPISASQINGSLLEAVPDKDGIFRGKYVAFLDATRDDEHLARDAQGKPWVLDLADPGLDASLRKRNPNSYQSPPVVAPNAPPPQPYRNAPGMIALSNAAETPE